MPPEATFPIAQLLEELGFVRIASAQQARSALIEAGLTNARKQNMALDKRQAAIHAITTRIARVCTAEACKHALPARNRRVVEVISEACEVCHGSDTTRATQQMVQDLVATRRTRLLVIGGSPNARTTLRDAVAGTPVTITFVEGDRPTGTRRAQQLAESHDVIVIWANTQLSHKTSQPFATAVPDRTFTCARRSVSALATDVSRHVSGGKR